jgi:hypothetical protein
MPDITPDDSGGEMWIDLLRVHGSLPHYCFLISELI